MTQIEKVLRHLQKFGSITTWEAIQQYGITRLSDKIFRLRKKGININSETKFAKNRFGENVHFSEYKLGGTNV